MNSETLHERLKRCAELLGGATALAIKTGIKLRTLHAYLSGEVKKVPPAKLNLIAEATGVSVEWLVTGQGPMMAGRAVREPAGSYEVESACKINVEALAQAIRQAYLFVRDFCGELDADELAMLSAMLYASWKSLTDEEKESPERMRKRILKMLLKSE